MIEFDTNKHGVATITLNRPEVHNAFNEELIQQLIQVIQECEERDDIRIVVLAANGKSFCAGADLNWMKRSAEYSQDENFEDAMQLAKLLQNLDELSKPTIAKVKGHAFGGGVGLIACCDITISIDSAKYTLSEVKLGLIPAIIGPFVVRAIGARAARRYFQSAERFDAKEAYRVGLIHKLASENEIDEYTDDVIQHLLQGGPQAQAASKKFIALSHQTPINKELLREAAKRIANLRVSDEGQEGLTAFLEKRKPRWNPDV